MPATIDLEYLYVDVPASDVASHRTNTFRVLLDHLVVPRKRLVDLGAGPCIFARIARDRGYEVAAVDARTDRIPTPQELGAIRFFHSDVRYFDLDDYDVVVMLGLLYHLPLEDQRSLLARASLAPVVIVETEIHVPELIASSPCPAWQKKMVSVGGYEGVIFPENRNAMASAGNTESFWHTPTSMLKLFEDTGFRHVKIIDPVFQSQYGARRFYLLAAEQNLRIA